MKNGYRTSRAGYEFQELLGEGLSSCVYKAIRRAPSFNWKQDVAIKILKSETDVRVAENCLGQLLKFRSPNCAVLLGFEQFEQKLGLVMDYVEGLSLRRFLETETLTTCERNYLLNEIDSGLVDLRSVGLFHGDLSPNNILIDKEGRIVLVDYGLSELHDQGIFQGTPQFCAPELFEKQNYKYASDVFSLGLLKMSLEKEQIFLKAPLHVWKERAHALIDQESCFAKDPQSRMWKKLPVKSNAQQALSKKVTKLLKKEQLTSSFQTLRAPAKTSLFPIWGLRRIAVFLVASTLGFPSGFFSKSQGSSNIRIQQAQLQIRSLEWYEILINGQSVGYSPITLHLAPGRYSFEWKNKKRRGSQKLSLLAGQKKILDESRLRVP